MAVRITGLYSTLLGSRRKRGVKRLILPFLVLLPLVGGCGGRKAVISQTSQPPSQQAPHLPPQSTPQQMPQPRPQQRPEPSSAKTKLTRMGYSIQVGAFSDLGNAIRLTESLEGQGLNAYYFRHNSGLYKVRFGDYATKDAALATADRLKKADIVLTYYIVDPGDYALARERVYGREYFREEIVETAESFIGLPYRWGGSSADTGFDCSGLTMAVYHLNGLNLPRSSWAQYKAGDPVQRSALDKGDLVFFATSGGKRVSHVGVYAGDKSFIHAPGKGKRIRMDSLSNRYYAVRYVGARTYLK